MYETTVQKYKVFSYLEVDKGEILKTRKFAHFLNY